jgi:hypothetical protein
VPVVVAVAALCLSTRWPVVAAERRAGDCRRAVESVSG